MHTRQLKTQQPSIQGRTLLEYLIVGLIVGVLMLVCVPVIKNLTNKATEGKAMANARTICDLYNGARSVDVVFTSPTKAGIVNELFAGVRSATLDDVVFQMPRLSGPDLVAALRYCRYQPMNDAMSFQPEGNEMLEVALVQDHLRPAAIGAVEPEDIEPESRQANEAPWERLPTWFTSNPEQSKRVLEYIKSNPSMVYFGVEFGTKEWRAEQGDNGLWWPEYRAR